MNVVFGNVDRYDVEEHKTTRYNTLVISIKKKMGYVEEGRKEKKDGIFLGRDWKR